MKNLLYVLSVCSILSTAMAYEPSSHCQDLTNYYGGAVRCLSGDNSEKVSLENALRQWLENGKTSPYQIVIPANNKHATKYEIKNSISLDGRLSQLAEGIEIDMSKPELTLTMTLPAKIATDRKSIVLNFAEETEKGIFKFVSDNGGEYSASISLYGYPNNRIVTVTFSWNFADRTSCKINSVTSSGKSCRNTTVDTLVPGGYEGEFFTSYEDTVLLVK